MKKIAITGATGFLGFRTALALAKLGHEVTALGRNVAIGRRLEAEDVYFVRSELSNVARMKETFRGKDCVIHLAALTKYGAPPEEYRQSNVIGTRNVMQAMVGGTVQRWIHLSTARLYSSAVDRYGVREEHPLTARGSDPYLESKRQNEIDIGNFITIPSIVLRPQLIFGPGDRRLYPFISRFAWWGKVPCFEGGETSIDPIYVDNVVDAIAAAVDAGDDAYDSAYNLSNGQPIENLSFLTTLAETLSRKIYPLNLTRGRALAIASILEPLYRAIAPNSETPLPSGYVRLFTESQTLSSIAAERALGFRPRISLRDGIQAIARTPRRLR